MRGRGKHLKMTSSPEEAASSTGNVLSTPSSMPMGKDGMEKTPSRDVSAKSVAVSHEDERRWRRKTSIARAQSAAPQAQTRKTSLNRLVLSTMKPATRAESAPKTAEEADMNPVRCCPFRTRNTHHVTEFVEHSLVEDEEGPLQSEGEAEKQHLHQELTVSAGITRKRGRT